MSGKELKDKLIKDGFKIAEIAVIIGVPEENIYGLLRAKSVNVKTLQIISKATKKTVSYWLGEVEHEVKKTEYEIKYYDVLEKYNACLEEKEKLIKFRTEMDVQPKLIDKNKM